MGPDIRQILNKTGYLVRPDTKFHYPTGYPVIRDFLAKTGYPDQAGYQKFIFRRNTVPAEYEKSHAGTSLFKTILEIIFLIRL